MVQKISILGATGSIGDSTLQVIDAHPDDFCVSAVTAGNNVAVSYTHLTLPTKA